jgi:hypothetical protein
MSVLIAVPVFRIGCKVGVDRGRAWSVIDEVVLWAIARDSKSIAALARDADLPHQIIIASVARLMRFRLVEVTLDAGDVAFRASNYGFRTVGSGDPLPFFPKRVSRRIGFVIERATGDFFPTREVRLIPASRLDVERQAGVEVRVISVEGGGPSMSHEANLNRLSDIAAWGWDEQVAVIDGRTATMRDDEFMVVRVIDGVPQGVPASAGAALRRLISDTAALPSGTTQVPVTYLGPREMLDTEPRAHVCSFDPADLIIGGSAQRLCFETLLGQAHRRMIIHSTFLDPVRFVAVSEFIRAACIRGVSFELLWGAEKDDETENKNAAAASEIARLVREDKDMQGRIRVHMNSTGSHAKLILLDTAQEGWIAAAGSCNWLSSPFQSVELSVILRDQRAVADVALAIQRLVGRRGLSDDIATEMAVTARDLRCFRPSGGDARISLIVGDAHDGMIRTASGVAQGRFVVGSNRLGSTAIPGALLQGEVAAARAGVRATVLYTQTTGPLKNRHARALAEEARSNGLMLVKTKKIPLHGKFVAWDDDDLIVTSLNWASASADPEFPWGEIGVHIQCPGIAAHALTRLEEIFPELRGVEP